MASHRGFEGIRLPFSPAGLAVSSLFGSPRDGLGREDVASLTSTAATATPGQTPGGPGAEEDFSATHLACFGSLPSTGGSLPSRGRLSPDRVQQPLQQHPLVAGMSSRIETLDKHATAQSLLRLRIDELEGQLDKALTKSEELVRTHQAQRLRILELEQSLENVETHRAGSRPGSTSASPRRSESGSTQRRAGSQFADSPLHGEAALEFGRTLRPNIISPHRGPTPDSSSDSQEKLPPRIAELERELAEPCRHCGRHRPVTAARVLLEQRPSAVIVPGKDLESCIEWTSQLAHDNQCLVDKNRSLIARNLELQASSDSQRRIHGQISELQETLARAHDAEADFMKDNGMLRAQVAGLRQEVADASADQQHSSFMHKMLKDRVSDLEQQVADWKALSEHRSVTHNTLQRQVVELERQLAESSLSKDNFLQKHSSSQGHITHLEQELKDALAAKKQYADQQQAQLATICQLENELTDALASPVHVRHMSMLQGANAELERDLEEALAAKDHHADRENAFRANVLELEQALIDAEVGAKQQREECRALSANVADREREECRALSANVADRERELRDALVAEERRVQAQAPGSELENVQARMKSAELRHAEVEKSLHAQAKAAQARVAELEALLDTSHSTAVKHLQQQSSLRSHIADLEQQLATANTMQADATARAKRLESKLSEAIALQDTAQLNHMAIPLILATALGPEDQSADLERRVEDLRSALESSNARRNELQAECEQFRRERAQLVSARSGANADSDKFQKECAQLRRRCEDGIAIAASHRAQVGQLERCISDLEKSLVAAQSNRDELQAEVQRRSSQAKSSLGSHASERAALLSELEGLRQGVGGAERQREDGAALAEAKIGDLERKLTSLERSLRNARSEASSAADSHAAEKKAFMMEIEGMKQEFQERKPAAEMEENTQNLGRIQQLERELEENRATSERRAQESAANKASCAVLEASAAELQKELEELQAALRPVAPSRSASQEEAKKVSTSFSTYGSEGCKGCHCDALRALTMELQRARELSDAVVERHLAEQASLHERIAELGTQIASAAQAKCRSVEDNYAMQARVVRLEESLTHGNHGDDRNNAGMDAVAAIAQTSLDRRRMSGDGRPAELERELEEARHMQECHDKARSSLEKSLADLQRSLSASESGAAEEHLRSELAEFAEKAELSRRRAAELEIGLSEIKDREQQERARAEEERSTEARILADQVAKLEDLACVEAAGFKELEQRNEELQQQCQNLQELENALEQAKCEKNDSDKEMASLKARAEELEKSLEVAQRQGNKQQVALRGQTEELERSLEQAWRERGEESRNNIVLRAKLEEVEQTLDTTNRARAHSTVDKQALREQREELERGLELAQRQSADGDAENVVLKAKAEELERVLEQVQRQKGDADAESAALKARLEELEQTLDTTSRAREQSSVDRQALTEMREELERSLELAQRQSADGDAENVALKARAEEFEHGLQQAQRQKRDAQAESAALKARLEELGKALASTQRVQEEEKKHKDAFHSRQEEFEKALASARQAHSEEQTEKDGCKVRQEELEQALELAQRQHQEENEQLRARQEELEKTFELADRKARAENDQKMFWKAQAEAVQNDLDTARKQHAVEKFAADTHAEELEKALEEAKCEKSDCDKAKAEIKGRVEELECELAETTQRHMDKEEQNLALITQREELENKIELAQRQQADEKQAFVAKGEELLETVSLAQALKDRSEELQQSLETAQRQQAERNQRVEALERVMIFTEYQQAEADAEGLTLQANLRDAEQRNRSMEAMQEAQQRRCRNHESELDAQHRRIQDLQALLDRAHVTMEGFARKHSSTELQLAEIEKQWSETMSMKNRYIGSLEQILNSPSDSRDEAQPGTGSARRGSAPAVQLHVRDEDEPPLAGRSRSQYYSIFGQGTGVSSAELRAAVANLPIAKPAAMASSSSPPPAARSPQSSDEGVIGSVQPAGKEHEDGDQLQAAVKASGDEDLTLGRPTPWSAPPPQAGARSRKAASGFSAWSVDSEDACG
mmetsp:Transcript_16535/g.57924  ORF Transcript_16535/g.57924 Transcript_16535/m.57924 type:complete len:2031 (-) Transcript_16535:99-6191(-)